MQQTYFADMHIHIGRDMYGNPVKITGAKSLTLTNILKEASRTKGIDLIGVIDCHAPQVQKEMNELIEEKKAYELKDGGIKFEEITLIPGAEIEIYDENCLGPIHVLCFFPNLKKIAAFTEWLKDKMKNINLSSQRYYGTGKELQYKVKELEGIFIPAHIFTPFKSLYGKGVNASLREVFDPDLIDAVELGLSSDTFMADQITELHNYTYVTNSDAHSLAKIAREYQQIKMKEASFKEFERALHQVGGRGIVKNFGMNPKLGKYHTTVCSHCFEPLAADIKKCPVCSSRKIIKGVSERILELKDTSEKSNNRPPYLYQVPLEYLPSLGPKTLEKLLARFGTEMKILHEISLGELKKAVPGKLAISIIQMRNGELSIKAGGGGKYGKVGP
jgi:uncharacterized protein (TIGR00375 family)